VFFYWEEETMKLVTREGFKRWLCHSLSIIVVILAARILLFDGGLPQGSWEWRWAWYILLFLMGLLVGEIVWELLPRKRKKK
jgi:hypothetical protein